ncbi:MAG TPA: hypothetical protein VMB19_00270, partial [Silvibacterium sp.]|nr:hypothetical protein [Silvibacterium sp.]
YFPMRTVTQVAESGETPADQSHILFNPVSAAMSTNRICVSQLTPIQGDTCALTTAWPKTVKTWVRSLTSEPLACHVPWS